MPASARRLNIASLVLLNCDSCLIGIARRPTNSPMANTGAINFVGSINDSTTTAAASVPMRIARPVSVLPASGRQLATIINTVTIKDR